VAAVKSLRYIKSVLLLVTSFVGRWARYFRMLIVLLKNNFWFNISTSLKKGIFNIPAKVDLDMLNHPLYIYTSCLLIFAFGVLCDMQDLYSQIPFQSSILLTLTESLYIA
jgi:hypothetical protein